MHRRLFIAGGVALLGCLSGCGMYYSRVGGTAHDKLYRGTQEEVAKAAEAALARHGYQVKAENGPFTLVGTISPQETVSVRVRPGVENLVEARVGSSVDWRKAVEIHRWIAQELGVLYRREP
jgi:hypothetical protein